MGIGAATARAFAGAGAKIAVAARSTHLLEQLVTELRAGGSDAIAITTDLLDVEQTRRAVEETVRHFGGLDVLVNNAGQAVAGMVEHLDLESFNRIIELNVLAPLVTMQAAIPVLRQRGGGLIINVTSMVSKMALPGLAGYAATKCALNSLSDTARVELAPENIRVISVYPRLTATGFGEHSLGDLELRSRQRATTSNLPVDSPEFVAERIVQAAIAEVQEQFMDH